MGDYSDSHRDGMIVLRMEYRNLEVFMVCYE